MVVTRKPPAPPVSTSRTNSAQPIPRVKGKLPQTVPDAEDGTERVPLLGEDDPYDASLKKLKGKWKGKQRKEKTKKKPKKSWSFSELLTRIFLVWFTIYTLSVCPDDQSLKKPVCRGLYTFRKLLIEPYLLPPLQHALAHPSVAPYVERAKPAVNFAIDNAESAALRTQQEFSQRILPQWNQRVVPQWQRHVVPQWQKHVVPQWKQHVGPYLELIDQHVRPYIVRVRQEYGRWVEPYARVTFIKLQEWQRRARPYVVLAAHKTYDGYQKAKPYAIPVFHKIQELLLELCQFLIQQRREFVDPHVRKIWEQMKELSRGDAKPLADTRNAFTSTLSKATVTASSIISSALHTSPSLVPKASEAVLGSASSVLPDVIHKSESLPAVIPTTDPVATIKAIPTAATSSAMSVVPSVVSEISSSASSLGAAASSVASSVASAAYETASSVSVKAKASAFTFGDAASSTYSVVSSAAQETISVVSSTVSSNIAPSASSAIPTSPAITNTDEDVDLDQFYADLGLDENSLPSESAVPASKPMREVPEETEEEKAEKLRLKQEETAQKRADITGRHSKWERELEEQIQENHKTLRRNLVALRKAAVVALSASEEIRGEIESLVEEAEKYIKGADKYISNLKRDGKSNDEKKALWERVVDKIDTKFADKLTQTESIVNEWYLKVLQKEIDEVNRLAAQVKDISDRAQADIGLDYAWLDDVTYNDWQRYHDLDRRSENFTAQAFAVQNGTDSSPPSNPIVTAIQDLQAEVQDVVVGFETRLRRIKRNGQRVFGASNAELDVEGDLSSGSGPSDETVSILPIEDGAKRPEDGASPADIPSIVVGRNKEEVISALNRAAEQDAQATSTPGDKDKKQKPEQMVESLAQEAVAEGHLVTSPPHDEL